MEKQINDILANMEIYAKKNDCEFSRKDFYKHTYFRFCENGFSLDCVINWKTEYLCIIDSEDDDAFCEMWFDDFVKFQEHFLTSETKVKTYLVEILKNYKEVSLIGSYVFDKMSDVVTNILLARSDTLELIKRINNSDNMEILKIGRASCRERV